MSKAGGARTTPVGQTFRSAQPIRSAGRPSSARLTHADAQGRVRMVDVSEKPVTRREAVARGSITMSAAARTAVRRGAVKKGDPLQAARLAGIMAAKQTSALIPLCHPVPLTSVNVELASTRRGYDIAAHVRTDAKTGVEMEALTAVAVAALTVYDMLKAIDKAMEIGEIRLVSKTGGKSGTWFGPNGRPAGKQPPGMVRSQRKRL